LQRRQDCGGQSAGIGVGAELAAVAHSGQAGQDSGFPAGVPGGDVARKPDDPFGIAPGDGLVVVWEETLGLNRARHLVITQGSFTAQQAREWGAVAEVVPLSQVLPRAQEIAEQMTRRAQLTNKYMAVVFRQRIGRRLAEGMLAGMAKASQPPTWHISKVSHQQPTHREGVPMPQQPVIVFDVNETLLDLDTLHPTLDRIFDDPAALRLWFAHLITYSEALTLAGVYVPFTDIGAAVLRMLAATRNITISDSDAAELTDRFATMPPHPEVPAALGRLRDHGFRLFTLTDNTLAISGRQLEHAGVIHMFERRFSVDETVRRHKPAAEAYHSVAAALQLDPADICLIACHVWDTIGAQAAGWQAGLILRAGNAPLTVGPQPDYIGSNLDEIVGQLITKYDPAAGQ
jgi:2-haloacid dehalogenase